MEEVYPNIFMITETGAMGALMPPMNLYVLAGHDGLVFDTGYGRKKILSHLEKEFLRIEALVRARGGEFNITRALPSHTHPDHFSGLRFLKNRFGIRSMLTPAMLDNMSLKKMYYRGATIRKYSTGRGKELLSRVVIRYFQPRLLGTTLERRPDMIIEEETVLSVNGEPWRVMPAPGHCDDHISLYSEKHGLLFSGDNIMRRITTWLGPPRSDLDAYQQTLTGILNLPNLKLILSAHGSPISEPRQRIEELLRHREQRTRDVLNVIQQADAGGIVPGEIVNRLYTGRDIQKRLFADGWILLTLEQLEKEGRIIVRERRVFMAAG